MSKAFRLAAVVITTLSIVYLHVVVSIQGLLRLREGNELVEGGFVVLDAIGRKHREYDLVEFPRRKINVLWTLEPI